MGVRNRRGQGVRRTNQTPSQRTARRTILERADQSALGAKPADRAATSAVSPRRSTPNAVDYSDRRQKRPGRPRIRQVIVDLVLRFAKENPTWGFDRIQGAVANVGYHISDTTVGNLLKTHGIEPAPDRQRTGTWTTFLKPHWDVLAAIDFTTIEVWTKGGLVTFYLLFVMELA